MNKQPTITIGIPAYNEAQSIAHMLKSILSQRLDGYVLSRIIVVSDGSSDNTVAVARSVKDSRISVIANRKNKGRVATRNQILRMCTTDILVFLDADGRFENDNSLNELVKPFVDSAVALVSGNPHSVGPDTFLNRCLATSRTVYTDIRKSIHNGNNVHSCFGGILAISQKLYQTLEIPNDIYADDSYMYFQCLSHNYKFVNVPTARVIHRFPKSLIAYINRATRHNKSGSETERYFGKLAQNEFHIPRGVFVKAGVRSFFRHPVYTVSIYALNFYIRKVHHG